MDSQLTRFMLHRRRLLIALALGIVVGVLAAGRHDRLVASLYGWNAFTLAYLLLVGAGAWRANAAHIRKVAAALDDFSVAVLTVGSLGAVFSLVAIVAVLAGADDPCQPDRTARLWLAASTVVLSWLLVPALFTLHYAHLYYRPGRGAPPLAFVDDASHVHGNGADPDATEGATHDYWDFAYFAFTIAVASQTADVATRGRAMRRTVLAQSILSFIFNASVIGMSVNIAASLAFTDRALNPASVCTASAPPPQPPR